MGIEGDPKQAYVIKLVTAEGSWDLVSLGSSEEPQRMCLGDTRNGHVSTGSPFFGSGVVPGS